MRRENIKSEEKEQDEIRKAETRQEKREEETRYDSMKQDHKRRVETRCERKGEKG